MSNTIRNACWDLQMPPTAKAVLVCMADYADDNGECWPSISAIAVRTCFSERAVQSAIRWLESACITTADRSNGRHTRYAITPDTFRPPQQMHPRSRCTGAANDQTPAADAGDPRSRCVGPPQQVPSTHQDTSRHINKATIKQVVHIELPTWLPKRVWNDWCDHRKAIKSPMTARAAELSIEKLADFLEKGLTPESVINNAIERGWRGLYPPNHTGPPVAVKPSAAADFRGKTYAATPLDQLPPDLRAAAERAMRDD